MDKETEENFHKKFQQDMKARIENYALEVRDWTDEELIDHRESEFSPTDSNKVDPALMTATMNEAHRRFRSSGWIWNRLLNPSRYQKFRLHFAVVELQAAEKAMDILDSIKNK